MQQYIENQNHFYGIENRPVLPATPTPILSRRERSNRSILLKRVRTRWIKGLLENSLHRAAWIDLRLQEQPDALENPWRLYVQELNCEPRALPADTSIIEVYDETDGQLLLLGEPGSGKTTLLLQLARTLLDRAEVDELQPIPVVFNLSSWAQKKQETLTTWIVEELETRYKINSPVGTEWIKANQILPLLDGLDEVANKAHEACAQAIIAYCKAGNPLVVCCRTNEYRAMSLRLPLQHAVSISELTTEQIDAYLSNTQKGYEKHCTRTKNLQSWPNGHSCLTF